MRQPDDLLVVTQEQYERLELEVVGLRDLEPVYGPANLTACKMLSMHLTSTNRNSAPKRPNTKPATAGFFIFSTLRK